MNPTSHPHWTRSSWKSKPICQQADYPDTETLSTELEKLKVLPPIVAATEVDKLRQTLAEVYNGKGFILQVGDCAEKFSDCTTEAIQHKVLFYDLLANLFTEITKMPTTVIGRMAGQFAKPRTDLYEIVDGKKIMNFKGENINGFHSHERTPDPKRMTEGYFKSATTMNYIRQMKDIDITCPHFNQKLTSLNAEATNNTENTQEKPQLQALHVKDKIQLKRDVFVSHEALHLDYEDTQVREEENKHYNLSAHFLWIGMRTNDFQGAHVEFFRGLENPIGVKLSKDIANTEANLRSLVHMIKLLNPNNIEGKLVLITRFGARYVEDALPKILKVVLEEDLKVLFLADGVHGNTQKVAGHKTRKLGDVEEEIVKTLKIFKDFGARLHGIHLELTPEEVTECLGGTYFEVMEEDLGRNYTTYCDPRLNFSQSIELVSNIANAIAK